VHPSRVSTREDLIRAFEHLAFLCLGPTARHAAPASSRRTTSPSTSSGSAITVVSTIGSLGRRRAVRCSFATMFRAIWKSQTRNVEAPSPSAGRARSRNRCRFASAARNVRSVASSAAWWSPSS